MNTLLLFSLAGMFGYIVFLLLRVKEGLKLKPVLTGFCVGLTLLPVALVVSVVSDKFNLTFVLALAAAGIPISVLTSVAMHRIFYRSLNKAT